MCPPEPRRTEPCERCCPSGRLQTWAAINPQKWAGDPPDPQGCARAKVRRGPHGANWTAATAIPPVNPPSTTPNDPAETPITRWSTPPAPHCKTGAGHSPQGCYRFDQTDVAGGHVQRPQTGHRAAYPPPAVTCPLSIERRGYLQRPAEWPPQKPPKPLPNPAKTSWPFQGYGPRAFRGPPDMLCLSRWARHLCGCRTPWTNGAEFPLGTICPAKIAAPILRDIAVETGYRPALFSVRPARRFPMRGGHAHQGRQRSAPRPWSGAHRRR